MPSGGCIKQLIRYHYVCFVFSFVSHLTFIKLTTASFIVWRATKEGSRLFHARHSPAGTEPNRYIFHMKINLTLPFSLVHLIVAISVRASSLSPSPNENSLAFQFQPSHFCHCWYPVTYLGGVGGVQPPPPPKFRSFDKGQPNSQFRGKYIRNNLIRIRV
jgi:hypothetical protein